MSTSQSFFNYVESYDGRLQVSAPGVDAGRVWRQRELDVLSFKELQDDWDGEGAPVFSDELVHSVVLYLSVLQEKLKGWPPTRVIASQDGEIVIEWQSNGLYIEVSISEPYHANWIVDRNDEITHYEVVWGERVVRENAPSPLWQQQYAVA